MAAEVSAALAGLDVTLVANPDYATGLASSLKAGIRALPPSCDGALILLGDMPQIAPEHLDRLIAAFAPDTIVVPVHEGRQGNPVLWPASFPRAAATRRRCRRQATDRRRMPRSVREVDLGTDAIFADIDTPEALARLRGRGLAQPVIPACVARCRDPAAGMTELRTGRSAGTSPG